jgi:hypothetical protein
VDGQIVGSFGGSNLPATFSFFLDVDTGAAPFSIDNSVFPISMNGHIDAGAGPFGITRHSAFASTIGSVSHVGPETGEFSVTFQSIAPDGLIDATNATGVAGYTFNDLDINITGYDIRADFHTVPKPSSIVTAACGALMVLVYAASPTGGANLPGCTTRRAVIAAERGAVEGAAG